MKHKDNDLFVYEFINMYISMTGYSPSVREIASACRLSTATVHYWINDLVKRGVLVKGPAGTSRTIRIAA